MAEIFTDLETGNKIKYSDLIDDNDLIEIVNKTIKVPPADVGRIFQGEANSCLLMFQVNRYNDGVDLKTKNIEIIYKTPDGTANKSKAINIRYSQSKLQFGWLLDYTATHIDGNVLAAIQILGKDEKDNDYVYKTSTFKLAIEKTLDDTELIDVQEPKSWCNFISDKIDEFEEVINSGALASNSDAGNVKYNDKYTVKDIIERLVSEVYYSPITVSRFDMNPSTTVYEIGSSVSGITFNWTYNKDCQSQSLTDCTLDNNSVRSATYDTSFSTNKTFTLSASDEKTSTTASKSILFKYPKYYGVATTPSSYNSAFLIGLVKQLVDGRSGNFTVNAGSDQHIFFAIPSSFGTASFSVGGFSGGFSKVATILHTNASGHTCNYDIYKSDNSGLGNTTVTVS